MRNINLILLLIGSLLFSACAKKEYVYIKTKKYEFKKYREVIHPKISFETKLEADVFKDYKNECKRGLSFYEEQIEDYERIQNESNR